MKKMMMTLAAVLCCAMATTVLSSCNKDELDTPEFANYSHSNQLQTIFIDGKTLGYQLSMYNTKLLAHQESEATIPEILAYKINYNINLAYKNISNTSLTPVTDIAARDRQAIQEFETALSYFKGSEYKNILSGELTIYRSLSGRQAEVIKVFVFPL